LTKTMKAQESKYI